MPPEISGHSSLPLHCFAPPLCNVSQLFLQKRLERTLDDLHKGTSFICKRTNYGQIFGFQRNTSKFEMVKHMLRIVSACYCGQKEKRCAKRLIAVPRRPFQWNDDRQWEPSTIGSEMRCASHVGRTRNRSCRSPRRTPCRNPCPTARLQLKARPKIRPAPPATP